MKVFLLEDNKIYARELLKFLKKRKYEIDICYNLDDYVFGEYDLYIIDLQIGDSFSLDIIRDIRNNTDNLILLSTHHTTTEFGREKIQESIDIGIDYILEKMDINMYSLQFSLIESKISRIQSKQKFFKTHTT